MMKMTFKRFEKEMDNCVRRRGGFLSLYSRCFREKEKNLKSKRFRKRRLERLILFRTIANDSKEKKILIKALFEILDKYEKEEKTELIYEIYNELEQKRRIDWTDLLFVMSHLDDDSIRELAEWYFIEEKYKTENAAGALGEIMASVFNEHFRELGDQYYRIVMIVASVVKNNYFLQRLEHRMKKLAEQSTEGSSCVWVKNEEHEAYFDYLCEKKAFQAAYSFLDRFWKTPMEDNENLEIEKKNLFGRSLDEIREKLLRIPFPSILNFGRKYICSRTDEYTDDAWYKEVKELNRLKDNEYEGEWGGICRWIEVYIAVDKLYDTVVGSKTSKEEENEKIKELSGKEMYDVTKYNCIPQLCANLAEVIKTWASDNEMSTEVLLEKIKALGNKNVFSYKEYDWYISQFRNYPNLVALDCNGSFWKERLKEVVEEKTKKNLMNAVELFFLTPSWMRIDFYDFLKMIKEKIKNPNDIERLLNNYPIVGQVIFADKRKGENQKFQLIPSYLYWEKSKGAGVQSGRKNGNILTRMYTRTIFVNNGEHMGEEFSPGSFKNHTGKEIIIPRNCNFKIKGFDKRDQLLVTGIKKLDDSQYETEDITIILEQFEMNFKSWVDYVRRTKSAVDWGGWIEDSETDEIVKDPVKVKFALPMEKRCEIAECITKLLIDLAKDDESDAYQLMRKCSFPPLEDVNEFRYIASKHWDDFTVDGEMLKRLTKIAEDLKNNESISAECRVEIYMNTCLRNVFPIESFLAKEELNKAFFEKKPEWVVPIVHTSEYYELMKDGELKVLTKFLMKDVDMGLPAMKSHRIFIAQDRVILNDENKNVIYGTIKKTELNDLEKLKQELHEAYPMDKELKDKDIFVLEKWYSNEKELKKHFPWTEYIRCYYDLKNKLSDKVMLDIYERLSKIEIELYSSKNTIQNIDELHSVIHCQRYDAPKLYEVLMLLGDKNVCYDPEGKYGNKLYHDDGELKITRALRKKWKKYMDAAYERLLNNEREKEKGMRDLIVYVGAVYYLSFLRVWVPESKFVVDLAEAREEDVDTVRKALESCRCGLNRSIDEEQAIWNKKLAKKREEETRRRKEKENKK